MTELRRKPNTGKKSKATAVAAPAAARVRLAPAPAPASAPAPARTIESPTKGGKRAPVGTVGSAGGDLGPGKEFDLGGVAPSLPLSALADPMAMLGPPPRDVNENGNSSQKKVQRQ